MPVLKYHSICLYDSHMTKAYTEKLYRYFTAARTALALPLPLTLLVRLLLLCKILLSFNQGQTKFDKMPKSFFY